MVIFLVYYQHHKYGLPLLLNLLELKYLKPSASDGDVEEAYKQAAKQLAQYAKDARLPQMMNGTQIHQVAVVYRGSDLVRIREVTE